MVDSPLLPFEAAQPRIVTELDALVESSAEVGGRYREDLSRLELLDKLVQARRARSLSQRSLASAMGTTQSALSDLEAGLTDPQLGTLQRYARCVGLELRWRLQFPQTKPVPSEGSDAGPVTSFDWEGVTPEVVKRMDRLMAEDPDLAAAEKEAFRRLELLDRLRAVREGLGLTQRDVAERLRIGQSAVSEFESRGSDPRLRTVIRYALALGAAIQWRVKAPKSRAPRDPATEAVITQAVDVILGPLLSALVRERDRDDGSVEQLVASLAPLPGPWATTLLDSLESGGWVRKRVSATGKGYVLDGAAAHLVGLSLHRDRVQGVLTDLNGSPVHSLMGEIRVPTRENVLAVSRDVVATLVEESRSVGVVGVGVSVAGVVRGTDGTILLGTSLRNDVDPWEAVPFEDDLQNALHQTVSGELLVAVENDANCLAMAEYLRRGDKSNTAVLLSGVGIGMGMVFEGRLARGDHDVAGEFGHKCVREFGPACRVGRDHCGCLETVASAEGILRTLGIESADHRSQEAGLAEAERRIAAGDAGAKRAFEDAGEVLGDVIAGTLLILDPGRIAFYAQPHFADQSRLTAQAFRTGVRSGMEKRACERFDFAPDPRIEWHVLTETARANAAAQTALWHFLQRPTRWAPSLLEPVVWASS